MRVRAHRTCSEQLLHTTVEVMPTRSPPSVARMQRTSNARGSGTREREIRFCVAVPSLLRNNLSSSYICITQIDNVNAKLSNNSQTALTAREKHDQRRQARCISFYSTLPLATSPDRNPFKYQSLLPRNHFAYVSTRSTPLALFPSCGPEKPTCCGGGLLTGGTGSATPLPAATPWSSGGVCGCPASDVVAGG